MEKRKNINQCIKDLLAEGTLVALYFVIGINTLKEKIDDMTDDEIAAMFEKLIHPQRVRSNVEYIYNKLNNVNKTV